MVGERRWPTEDRTSDGCLLRKEGHEHTVVVGSTAAAFAVAELIEEDPTDDRILGAAFVAAGGGEDDARGDLDGLVGDDIEDTDDSWTCFEHTGPDDAAPWPCAAAARGVAADRAGVGDSHAGNACVLEDEEAVLVGGRSLTDVQTCIDALEDPHGDWHSQNDDGSLVVRHVPLTLLDGVDASLVAAVLVHSHSWNESCADWDA